MKEALFWEKVPDKKYIQCHLCPWNCKILNGKVGNCRVRKNIDGTLFSLNYGRNSSVNIDPIEKKPLYHVLPGTPILSIGSSGCNLHCKNCQNWEISQRFIENPPYKTSPKEILELAKRYKTPSIAYTYNEPTVFYEFTLDCSRLSNKENMLNVYVTNGYISKEPLMEIAPVLDAANIDIKGFDEKIYNVLCGGGHLEAYLEALKNWAMPENKIFIELTNLVIPGWSDDLDKTREMVRWIIDNLGPETPIHFSRYFPMYQLDAPATPLETLKKATSIAKEEGMYYIYVGNAPELGMENTICPGCNEIVIERRGYRILKNNIRDGKCLKCGYKIHGIFS